MSNKSLRLVAAEIPFEHERKGEILETFFSIVDYYKKYPNPGACHLISGIFHVLLNEQNIKNELCIGEVKTGEKYFDHSWIEINGEIFDIAIQNPLDESVSAAPIYGGYDLSTCNKTGLIYGAKSLVGLGEIASGVLKQPFVAYMNSYGNFKDGAWRIVKQISKDLRLKVNINELKIKCSGVNRTFKK